MSQRPAHLRGGAGAPAGLFELDERPHSGLLDAGHGGARSRAQADRDRNRLLVIEQQRRHRAPGLQPIPARGARQRLDWIAVIADPQGATFTASKFVPENRDLGSQVDQAAHAA
jgi:hypothetical protein